MRWVVTGTNRGIGLEMVRQLAARGDEVVATVRDVAAAHLTRALADASGGKVRVVACDVRSDADVGNLAREVGELPVDVVVNNAGVMGKMLSLEGLDLADAVSTFNTNALGPIRVVRALLPALSRSRASVKRVVQVSSGMGSITDNTSGGAYAYRMSKAALNMANKSMSVDLAARGFVCIVMNPGWVQTDMGGSGANTPVDVSVRNMLGRIDALAPEDNGAFFDHKGGTFPY